MAQLQQTHKEYVLSFLPPGYRFEPREKELILYYLYPKLSNHPFPSFPVIQFDEFCNTEPWTIWNQFSKIPGEDLFFFSFFPKVSTRTSAKNSIRKVNGIGPGRWHGEDKGTPISVFVGGKDIYAVKKRFNYKNPGTTEHDWWIMYEYSIPSLSDTAVLCRLRNKHEKEKENDDNKKPQTSQKRNRNRLEGLSVASSTVTSDHGDCYVRCDPRPSTLSQPSNVDDQPTSLLPTNTNWEGTAMNIQPPMELQPVNDNGMEFDDDNLMAANAIAKKKTRRDAASSWATVSPDYFRDDDTASTIYQPFTVHQNEQQPIICSIGLEPEQVSDNWESFLHTPGQEFDIDNLATNPIASSSYGVASILSAASENTQDQYVVLPTSNADQAAATEDNACERQYVDAFNYEFFHEDQMAANSITFSANVFERTTPADYNIENQIWMQLEGTDNDKEAAATENFDFDSVLAESIDFDPSSFNSLECEGTDSGDANWWNS